MNLSDHLDRLDTAARCLDGEAQFSVMDTLYKAAPEILAVLRLQEDVMLYLDGWKLNEPLEPRLRAALDALERKLGENQ